MPISGLQLSSRAENCLRSDGIETVGDLLRRSRDGLLKIKNVGEVTVGRIEEKLAEQGLEIGLLAEEEEAQD
jgi:DNA-directed RNA polymerase subunit alpha